jgi:hypothetical protein
MGHVDVNLTGHRIRRYIYLECVQLFLILTVCPSIEPYD